MVKQAVAIIVLSVLIILGMPYAQTALQFILSAHNWVADILKDVFSGGQIGNLVRELLALLVIPVIVSLVPVLVLWLARRQWFTYFMELVWIIWMMQVSAIVITSSTSVANVVSKVAS